MELLLAVAAALFGATVGSFLNALSFRWGTGRGILWARSTSLTAGRLTRLKTSRSRCMHCGHALGVLDLVLILSYAYLRGRCRYCHARISLQYPLVEAAAALISLIVYLKLTMSTPGVDMVVAYAFWMVVWMTLLFVVVYDLRHTIIPWSCSVTLGALALLYLALSFGGVVAPVGSVASPLWALLAGPLLALPLFLLSLVSRGTWMGWGDSALELSLGWFLGISLGATALMLAFWIGASVGIVLLTLKKGFRMGSEIPFAPFLVFGAFAVYVLQIDFFNALPFLFS